VMEQRDVWSRGGKIVDRPPNKLSLRVKSFSTHSAPPTKHKPMRKYTRRSLRVCFFFISLSLSLVADADAVRPTREKKIFTKRKKAAARALTNKREFV
jgi:hypothetical protein